MASNQWSWHPLLEELEVGLVWIRDISTSAAATVGGLTPLFPRLIGLPLFSGSIGG